MLAIRLLKRKHDCILSVTFTTNMINILVFFASFIIHTSYSLDGYITPPSSLIPADVYVEQAFQISRDRVLDLFKSDCLEIDYTPQESTWEKCTRILGKLTGLRIEDSAAQKPAEEFEIIDHPDATEQELFAVAYQSGQFIHEKKLGVPSPVIELGFFRRQNYFTQRWHQQVRVRLFDPVVREDFLLQLLVQASLRQSEPMAKMITRGFRSWNEEDRRPGLEKRWLLLQELAKKQAAGDIQAREAALWVVANLMQKKW